MGSHLSTPSRRRVAAVAVAVLALGTWAGCGGDDEDTSASSTTAAATEDGGDAAAPATNPDGSLASVAGEPCVEADLSEAGPLGAEIDFPAGDPPSELVVEDVEVGTGDVAALGDAITVNYHGVSCSTGEVFDSSFARGEPATFGLVEGGLIEGWTEGIPGMKVGGTRLLVIPPELGYGEQGNQGIAPDETLVFVVELVDVG